MNATGILLPGWDCPSCGVFNGSAKEDLVTCRCCGTAKPKSASVVMALVQWVQEKNATLGEVEVSRIVSEILQIVDPDYDAANQLRHQLRAVYENLTSVQERCTELLLENRELKLKLIDAFVYRAPDQNFKRIK